MFSASEIFDMAIQIEENGEHFYRRALEGIPDRSLREMLQWVANEEAEHRNRFLAMKKLAPRSSDEKWAEQVGGTLLKSSLQDHIFSLDEVDLAATTDLQALLDTALVLEQDSVMFYEIIASFVSEPDILQQVTAIVAEEQKHIEALEERKRSLGDSSSSQ